LVGLVHFLHFHSFPTRRSSDLLGSCVSAFNSVVERLQERRAFGRPVGKFPSVQFGISTMLSDLLAMESLVHGVAGLADRNKPMRSEEHTSELQSRENLVCRLLL